ncbi:MAG: hypothetical protein Q8N45_04525 [Anaerolineales bacterium]|nr:hypothetical protein [Anaerolineales bacterium]
METVTIFTLTEERLRSLCEQAAKGSMVSFEEDDLEEFVSYCTATLLQSLDQTLHDEVEYLFDEFWFEKRDK